MNTIITVSLLLICLTALTMAVTPQTVACNFDGDNRNKVYSLASGTGVGTTFRLPEGWEIQDFVVVGVRPAGADPEIVTRLGDGVVLRSHTVIYAGVVMGRGGQTGHAAQIRELSELGDNVSVGSHSVVEHHVRIADGVRIHSQVFVPEFSVLEEDCGRN